MNEFKKWMRRYKKLHPESAAFADTLLSDKKFPWDDGGTAMYRHILLAPPAQYSFPVSAMLFKTLYREFIGEAAKETT